MGKKVLIVTYYWPPVGGSGVQRWLKMSRYLAEFGWDPVIYTPENPSFGAIDVSLVNDVPPEAEVIRLPIWEPYQLFAWLKGKKGSISASDIRIKEKKGFLDYLSLWIRGNFFIPDPRVFWVKPSVKFLPDIIESNGIEAVITTGPPHSMHLIGLKLKKKTGVKWIADFRDPWSEWDLYNEMPMTSWARKKHISLEKKVLKEADEVFATNKNFSRQFEKIGQRPVKVISNGFDEADFKDFKKEKTNIFTIRHIGMLDEMRDPSAFLLALEGFIKGRQQDIFVEFIGNVSEVYKRKIQGNPLLKSHVNFKDYQPHEEIINLYRQTDVLLLVLTQSANAEGNTPGKIYEYIASGARILALGATKGEVAEILNSTNAGIIVEHDEVKKIGEALEQLYKEYIAGIDKPAINIKNYSRRAQAGMVAQILDKL